MTYVWSTIWAIPIGLIVGLLVYVLSIRTMTSRTRTTALTIAVTSLVWHYLHVAAGLGWILLIEFFHVLFIIF